MHLNSIPLDVMRRTASRILAAAVQELFPDSHPLEGAATPLGFYYDFKFSFAFREEFLTLLEEKMRCIAKEERSIQILEMMPRNAAEFLLHHQLPKRAEAARKIAHPLTEVIKMGTFIDLCEGGSGEHAGCAGIFKLQEFQVIGESVRIHGTAFPDKQSLKDFLKKRAHHPQCHYEQLGKDLSLFYRTETGWIWSARGESLRQLLVQMWKEAHEEQNFHIIHSSTFQKQACHLAYHTQTQITRLAEIWYDCGEEEECESLLETPLCMQDSVHIFLADLDPEVISSLQFMLKIYKMFDFEVEFFQCPSWRKKQDNRLERLAQSLGLTVQREMGREKADLPTLEMRVIDFLGRKWPVADVQVDFEGGCLARSLFLSLERVIALLLERHEGALPFWLAPEQVRVIAVQHSWEEEARRARVHLQSQGLRAQLDCGTEKLGKRVHNSLREKVPYCILVGERVTLKDNRSGKEEEWDLKTIASFLQELNRKRTFENK